MPYLPILAEDEKGSGGGGPDDPYRHQGVLMRMQGFIAIVFGMALGLTLVVFFLIFRWGWITAPTTIVAAFVGGPFWNLLASFAFGFIAGTLFSAFYNLLVFRRINLFGLDRMMN